MAPVFFAVKFVQVGAPLVVARLVHRVVVARHFPAADVLGACGELDMLRGVGGKNARALRSCAARIAVPSDIPCHRRFPCWDLPHWRHQILQLQGQSGLYQKSFSLSLILVKTNEKSISPNPNVVATLNTMAECGKDGTGIQENAGLEGLIYCRVRSQCRACVLLPGSGCLPVCGAGRIPEELLPGRSFPCSA